jgi:multidrug efflux pump subunit AcrB
MLRILKFFIERPRVTGLLIAASVIFGFQSLQSLSQESDPEVEIPIAVVSTIYAGASPADIETLVTNKIETKLESLENVKEMTSSSVFNVSMITVEFEAEADLDKSIRDLKDKVDEAKVELPSEAEEPKVTEISVSDTPIVTFSLGGKGISDEQLFKISDEIETELKKISGVSEIIVLGKREKEILIALEKEKLAGLNLSAAQVLSQIRAAHTDFPLGEISIENENFSARVEGKFKTADDLQKMPILSNENGTIFLREISKISETREPRETQSLLSVGGAEMVETISLQIKKKTGGNIIEIVDAAKAKLEKMKTRGDFPKNLEIQTTNDESKFIRQDLTTLISNLKSTILIVILIIWIALGIREALLVGLSIPLVFLLTFLAMKIMGQTLNGISLFSLVLALGMMVDTTIVIIEGIFDGLKLKKLNAHDAAVFSVKSFYAPLISGTLTTVSAFVPMLMMSGIMGQYMSVIPKTISAALSFSLIVALFFIPAIATLIFRDANLPHRGLKSAVNGGGDRADLIFRDANSKKNDRADFNFQNSQKFPDKNSRDSDELTPEISRGLTGGNQNSDDSDELSAQLTARITETENENENSRDLNLQNEMNRGLQPAADELQNPADEISKNETTEFKFTIAAKKLLRKNLEKILQSSRRRWAILSAFFVALIISIKMVGAGVVSVEMFPAVDADYFNVEVEMPAGTKLSKTFDAAKPVVEILRAEKEVKNFLLAVGGGSVGRTEKISTGGSGSSHVATFTVNLSAKENRDEFSGKIVKRIRGKLEKIKTVGKISITELKGGPPTGKEIELRISGDELNSIENFAKKAKKILEQIPGAIEVSDDISHSGGEFVFAPRREVLNFYNLQTAAVAADLRTAIYGSVAAEIARGDDEIEIRVEFDWKNSDRRPQSLAEIENLLLQLPNGKKIPAAEIFEIKFVQSFASIAHRDGERTVKVSASADKENGFVALKILNAFREKVEKLPREKNLEISFGGENEDIDKSFSDLFNALIVGVILIAFILVLQFQSFVQPFIIISTVPFSLVAVIFGFFLFGWPISLPTFIGIVSLFGIIINDAIVLIDKINQNRRAGISRENSIIDGAVSRLKPIFLTSLTTVCGILPLSISDEVWGGLGFAIVFGLSTSTFLILVLVPIEYVLFDEFSQLFSKGKCKVCDLKNFLKRVWLRR